MKKYVLTTKILLVSIPILLIVSFFVINKQSKETETTPSPYYRNPSKVISVIKENLDYEWKPVIKYNTDISKLPILKWHNKEIIKNDSSSKIAINYPEFIGGDTVDNLNQYINETINKIIENTKNNLREKVNTDPVLYEGSKIDLNITYKVAGVENGIVSIEFIITDFSGGGNGSHDFPMVINWDLKSNRLLKNNELFCSENHIPKLIPIVRKQIIQNFSNSNGILQQLPKEVIDWVYRGTENEPDNWNNFLLSKDGLIVVFPSYQVISGGGGVVHALIPYTDIPNVLCLP